MRAAWWSGALLCLGCVANTSDPPVRKAEASVVRVDQVRESLRARLDASGLVLSPSVTPGEGAFDDMAALSALSSATGGRYASMTEMGVWKASNGVFQASFDLALGSLLVEGPEAYDSDLAPLDDLAHEQRARSLLEGLVPDLPAALVVRHLGAATRFLTPDAGTTVERLGTKVFAFRALGGLPVSGNRLIVSYLNDGRLRVLRGQWPSLDLERSQLVSTLSQSEAIDRALDVLMEHGVSGAGDEPIVLESFYEPRLDQQGWVVVLRGSARVAAPNAEGSSMRRERHDFDL